MEKQLNKANNHMNAWDVRTNLEKCPRGRERILILLAATGKNLFAIPRFVPRVHMTQTQTYHVVCNFQYKRVTTSNTSSYKQSNNRQPRHHQQQQQQHQSNNDEQTSASFIRFYIIICLNYSLSFVPCRIYKFVCSYVQCSAHILLYVHYRLSILRCINADDFRSWGLWKSGGNCNEDGAIASAEPYTPALYGLCQWVLLAQKPTFQSIFLGAAPRSSTQTARLA